jgi:two-component system response regulator MtrA
MNRILIVEDDGHLVAELVDLLTSEGFDVRHVSDGEQALSAVSDTAPDVVLLDLRMPHMNGFTFAGLLRSNRKMSRLPIVAMTGYYTRPEDATLMKALGIDACLTKPFTPKELLSAIDAVLGRPEPLGDHRAP